MKKLTRYYIHVQYLLDKIRPYNLKYLIYHYSNIYKKRKKFYKPVNKNLLSIIIVTHNSGHCLNKALWLFEKNRIDKDIEIIIIDNNSKDKSYLKKYERKNNYKIVYNNENLMFTRAVNQGMKIANGGYVLLLNPDVSWDKNLKDKPVTDMINVLDEDKKNGIVGLLQKYPDSNKISFYEGHFFNVITKKLIAPKNVFIKWRAYISTMDFLNKGKEVVGKHKKTKKTLWVMGSVFLIKRDLINRIGFLPYNRTCTHVLSDIIYCQIAIKNGWYVLTVGDSYAYHDFGKSCEESKIGKNE